MHERWGSICLNTKQKTVFLFVFRFCNCQAALSGQLGRETGWVSGRTLSLKMAFILPTTNPTLREIPDPLFITISMLSMIAPSKRYCRAAFPPSTLPSARQCYG